MWKLSCGCGSISSTPFEFRIYDDPVLVIDSSSNSSALLPNSTDRSNCLKQKIIQDYYDIINKLECGIQPDLQNLLEELSLVQINTMGSLNIAKQIFLDRDYIGDYEPLYGEYWSDDFYWDSNSYWRD